MKSTNGNTKGGLPARIGIKFHSEMERIRRAKKDNGTSRNEISTEKVSNIIIRHKAWPEIVEDIIETDESKLKEKWE